MAAVLERPNGGSFFMSKFYLVKNKYTYVSEKAYRNIR